MRNDRLTTASGETRKGFRVSYAAACDRLSKGMAVFSMGMIGIYVVITVANVLMRYLFNAPMGWVSDMNAIFVPLAMAPGLAVAAARGTLIVVTMVGERFPRPMRLVLTAMARAATVAILAIIAWKVFGYAASTLAQHRTTLLIALPIWPVWYAVAAIFALAVPLSLAPPLTNPTE